MEQYPEYNKVMTKLKEHNCSKAYMALKDLETSTREAKVCAFDRNVPKPLLASILVWAETKEGYAFWEDAAFAIGEKKKPVFTDPTKKRN
jgi:hypothetical protein